MGTDSKVVTGDYYDVGRLTLTMGTPLRVPLAMGFRFNGNEIAISGDNAE